MKYSEHAIVREELINCELSGECEVLTYSEDFKVSQAVKNSERSTQSDVLTVIQHAIMCE
jgi:hypothetical protein